MSHDWEKGFLRALVLLLALPYLYLVVLNGREKSPPTVDPAIQLCRVVKN